MEALCLRSRLFVGFMSSCAFNAAHGRDEMAFHAFNFAKEQIRDIGDETLRDRADELLSAMYWALVPRLAVRDGGL